MEKKARVQEGLSLLGVEEIMAMEQWTERWEAILKTLLDALEQEKPDIDPETVYDQQDPLPTYGNWMPTEGGRELRNQRNGEEIYYHGDRLTQRWLKTRDRHGRPESDLRSFYGDHPHFTIWHQNWQYEPGDSEYRVAKDIRSIWKKESEEAISQDLLIWWMEPAILVKPYYVDRASEWATTILQASLLNGRAGAIGIRKYEPFATCYDDSAAKQEAVSRRPLLYLAKAEWGERETKVQVRERSPAGEIVDITIARDVHDKISYSFSQEAAEQLAA